MFGFEPRLPITEEQRLWVNEGFQRLDKLLGRQRMLESRAIEPTAKDFPDYYDNTPFAVEQLFARVCSYMRVDRNVVELEIFPDETEELRRILPSWTSGGEAQAAGLYLHGHEREQTEGAPMLIAIRSTMIKDPMFLVATIAHELGHAILLGRRLMSPLTPDHEPITDLLTVYLGMGIFNGNSAARFRQFQDEGRIGWSTQRLG